jgi:L-amino acid N-acyltransferase YncA
MDHVFRLAQMQDYPAVVEIYKQAIKRYVLSAA